MSAVTTHLGDGPFWCEVATQDDNVPLRRERPIPRPDHILFERRPRRHVREHLRDGAAIDRERVAVQHAVRIQDAHHLRNPPGAMQIRGDVAP